MAVDQALNPEINSLNEVAYSKTSDPLTDAKTVLPANWAWKQAYYAEMKVNDQPKKVVLVPFSEAGQSAANIEVWIQNQVANR